MQQNDLPIQLINQPPTQEDMLKSITIEKLIFQLLNESHVYIQLIYKIKINFFKKN